LQSHSCITQTQKDKEDRTWTISSPAALDKETLESGLLIRQNGFRELPNETNSGFDRQLFVKAAELDHLKGVQTFGYTVEEQTPPGIIDPEKAKALGLQPSKKYSLLKCGIPVMNDDGSTLIEPHQVLTQTFRARKLAFLADHRRVPESMAKLCTNSDVLIQEATLSIKDGIDKVKIRGHNNAYNAGVNGNRFGCKVVALNHFASQNAYEGNVDEMVREAQSGNGGASRIVASYDFIELWVPRGGFEFDDKIGDEGGRMDVVEDVEKTALNEAGA
jgi:ribonuclease BN (tRNA processing enzyme)